MKILPKFCFANLIVFYFNKRGQLPIKKTKRKQKEFPKKNCGKNISFNNSLIISS